LIRREGRVGFFVMCGRSNCSPINLPWALKMKPRVRRTMCEMWPTKEDFRIQAKNFDLTNGLNILRIISGLFFFPHVMGKFAAGTVSAATAGLFARAGFQPARGMGLRRCRFGNRGGGCAGAGHLHAVCGARRRRAARDLVAPGGQRFWMAWNTGGYEYPAFWAIVSFSVAIEAWKGHLVRVSSSAVSDHLASWQRVPLVH
jgi:putative oxidoreductase